MLKNNKYGNTVIQ